MEYPPSPDDAGFAKAPEANDWPNTLPGFKSPATPSDSSGSLGDEGFPGPFERKAKLAGVFGDLIFRTDWEENPFRPGDDRDGTFSKHGYLLPPGAGPSTRFWNKACLDGVFGAMFNRMESRGLPVKSILFLKHYYTPEGENTAITAVFLGFSSGVAEDPVARVLARQCALELKGFLAENGHDSIPCYAHEVDIIGPKAFKYMPLINPNDSTTRVANTFTSTLGSCLGLENSPRIEGSLGLWMARSDRSNKRYAVTCRHILEPDRVLTNRKANQEFRFEEAGRPAIRVLMPGDATYESMVTEGAPDLVNGQELILDHYQLKLDNLEDDGDRASLAHDVQKQEIRVRQAKALRDVELPARKDKEARTIGKLAWAPRIHKPEDASFVIDVCVVEVDLDDLGGQVPENTINCAGYEELLLKAMNPRIGEPIYFKLGKDSAIRLGSRSIPMEEIREPPIIVSDGQNRLMLAKDGRSTGITVGYSAGSLVAYEVVVEGQRIVSVQPCVVAQNKRSGKFSEKGDSGSWIWDRQKRLAGVLTSGAGFDDRTDVTFYLPHCYLGPYLQKEMGLYFNV